MAADQRYRGLLPLPALPNEPGSRRLLLGQVETPGIPIARFALPLVRHKGYRDVSCQAAPDVLKVAKGSLPASIGTVKTPRKSQGRDARRTGVLSGPVGTDDPGGVSVDIKHSSETWSTYELADGTTLRLRPVLVDVQRLPKFNEDGDPVYAMKTTVLVDAKVPGNLRKK